MIEILIGNLEKEKGLDCKRSGGIPKVSINGRSNTGPTARSNGDTDFR